MIDKMYNDKCRVKKFFQCNQLHGLRFFNGDGYGNGGYFIECRSTDDGSYSMKGNGLGCGYFGGNNYGDGNGFGYGLYDGDGTGHGDGYIEKNQHTMYIVVKYLPFAIYL